MMASGVYHPAPNFPVNLSIKEGRNMKYFSSVALLALSVSLVACGGGSSGSDAVVSAASSKPANVASAEKGGVATASYDAGNAGLVNDGDTTTSNYWAGNVKNDYVEVEFAKTRSVSEFTVHTNATNNTDTRIEFSEDGVTFTAVSLVSQCFSLSLGSNRIACTLATKVKAKYVRVVVVASSGVGNRRIYEIEVTGK